MLIISLQIGGIKMKDRIIVGLGMLSYLVIWVCIANLIGNGVAAHVTVVIAALLTLLITVFIFVPYGVLKVNCGELMRGRKMRRRAGKVAFVERFGESVVFKIEEEINTYVCFVENPVFEVGNVVRFTAPDIGVGYLVECRDIEIEK